jgi:hypothetical protein
MATIETGILGVTRGKIANVVGAKWKQTNYIRKLTTPANPKSEAQLIQRGKLSALVEYVKPIIAPFLHPFVDPFQKSQSGYNRFIQANIGKVEDNFSYDESMFIITEGQLTSVGGMMATILGDVITFTWETRYGVNGKPTDLVMIGAHKDYNSSWSFLPTPVLRSAETADLTLPGADDGHSWACIITYSETINGRLLLVSANEWNGQS